MANLSPSLFHFLRIPITHFRPFSVYGDQWCTFGVCSVRWPLQKQKRERDFAQPGWNPSRENLAGRIVAENKRKHHMARVLKIILNVEKK